MRLVTPDAAVEAGVAGKAGGSGGTGGVGKPRAECFVDFPCFGRTMQCAGERQLRRLRDVPCSEYCGDRPCSGGACKPTDEIIDCPPGLHCRDVQRVDGRAESQCVALDDAGLCEPTELDAGAVRGVGCAVEWGCGDGTVGKLEACDDGNRAAGDGCSANCTVEPGFQCPREGGQCGALSGSSGTGETANQLQALQHSRELWDSLVAATGESYYYAEENCLINVDGPDYAVTTIQVDNGVARSLGRSLVDPSKCEARVNRYESFNPQTLPELYAQCEQLVRRNGSATKVGFDARGVLKSCMYAGDSGCFDNCGEGFYLRTLAFGMIVAR